LQHTIRWTLAGTSIIVVFSSLSCKCCVSDLNPAKSRLFLTPLSPFLTSLPPSFRVISRCWLSDINFVCFVIWPGILQNPWLHPQVFGLRATSVATSFGMLMASGIVTSALTNSEVTPTISRMWGRMKNSLTGSTQIKSRKSGKGNGPSEYEVNPSSMEFEE
jgi:hypothetical protein